MTYFDLIFENSTSSKAIENPPVCCNMLMIDPLGAGKTLLACSLPGILPRMTIDEALDVIRIYSVSDLLP